MNGRAGRIAGIVLVGVLVCPGIAHASLWDLIWKMSGPQMSGFPLHCEWTFGDKNQVPAGTISNVPNKSYSRFECREFDLLFLGNVKPRSVRRMWLSVDGGPYFSTGKNPHGPGSDPDYEAFEVWMVVAEPILEFNLLKGPVHFLGMDVRLNHGVGATYDVFFGDDFPTFDKAGLKFKPVVATFPKRINAALNVRWYPNGTTPDEFGKSPRLDDLDRENEWVIGVSFGVLWR